MEATAPGKCSHVVLRRNMQVLKRGVDGHEKPAAENTHCRPIRIATKTCARKEREQVDVVFRGLSRCEASGRPSAGLVIATLPQDVCTMCVIPAADELPFCYLASGHKYRSAHFCLMSWICYIIWQATARYRECHRCICSCRWKTKWGSLSASPGPFMFVAEYLHSIF